MKKLFSLMALLGFGAAAQSQDMPNPSANVQLMPEGSYIIAMDNSLQANTNANPTKQYFNLKAYGLIVYLLNNNIKVKRIIKTGKAKDAIDFSVDAKMVKPAGETNAVLRDFKAGPFVVFAYDVFHSNIDRLIDNYNNNAGGVSGIADPNYKVKVYKTTADVDVDVRFDYNGFKPKACILNDGGNAAIHTSYMTMAGIPAVNYTVDLNNSLTNGCYTFASEPHNASPLPSVVTNITNFVKQGGNFLAECEAVPQYEALGHFQTTGGITVTNSDPSSITYINADLNYAQFEGPFDVNQGGSCTNWKLASSSAFINHAYAVAANSVGASPIGASASKLNALNALGGMVFYLGNHSFKSITNYDNINGVRLYMNALLTPANTQSAMKYDYGMSCNANAMKVNAFDGTTGAYPVSFYLYADNGTTPGSVDPGDVFIGAATVTTSNEAKSISVAPPYNFNTPLVMKVTSQGSCFSADVLQPITCNFITLPAELKNFSAQIKNKQVALTWETVYEKNITGFYVQRFIGNEWRDIAFVTTKAKNRSINNYLSYNYFDVLDFSSSMPYRLAIVDADGTMRYSEVKAVTNNEEASIGYSIYPVPSKNGDITISFNTVSKRKIIVIDCNGRIVKSIEELTDKKIKIQGLLPGVYVVQVDENNRQTQSQKIIVQ